MTHPRCSVFIAASLDGYIARQDGSVDWLSLVSADHEDYGYAEFAKTVDTLLIGRNTWETARGFDPWPYSGKKVVVLTHRPAEAAHGETFTSERLGDLLERLHREGARQVYVDGGAVISQFIEAGLLTDFTLSIIPVILGAGRRLFTHDLPQTGLTLTSSRSWPSGLVQLRYAVASRGA